jgi:hypothetical protein
LPLAPLICTSLPPVVGDNVEAHTIRTMRPIDGMPSPTYIPTYPLSVYVCPLFSSQWEAPTTIGVLRHTLHRNDTVLDSNSSKFPCLIRPQRASSRSPSDKCSTPRSNLVSDHYFCLAPPHLHTGAVVVTGRTRHACRPATRAATHTHTHTPDVQGGCGKVTSVLSKK